MKEKAFIKTIKTYYKKHKRILPWRETSNPYHILVSEIMLQQTQVSRVVEKYTHFLNRFPTPKDLAQASTRDVLMEWQGLGYNRRGLNLHRTAKILEEQYTNTFPQTQTELDLLPGVGPYTASAILAFAFNIPEVCIETNIRTVYIHFFFPHKKKVPDNKLLPLIEKTLDRKNPRDWYGALMDYGTMLKMTVKNPSQKSLHYQKQKPFKGSRREIRSHILTHILKKPSSHKEIATSLKKPLPETKLLDILTDLQKEGFIIEKKGIYGVRDAK